MLQSVHKADSFYRTYPHAQNTLLKKDCVIRFFMILFILDVILQGIQTGKSYSMRKNQWDPVLFVN